MFNPFNFQIKKTTSLAAERQYYHRVINGLEELNKVRIQSDKVLLNELVAGLVFSKDRAMQLHALLLSYFKCAQNPAPITVLFKASDERFMKSYQELMQEVQSYPVHFVEETNFYEQVSEWVRNNKADRIFFMTDDAIFLDQFDFNDILHFNPLDTIFSLTKGTDLTFCFNHNCPQELPKFAEVVDLKNSKQPFLEWVWEDMQASPDWNYPLSVDATFFYQKELQVLLDNIQFKNPNSLEANLQVFVKAFLPRKGACYRKAKYVNIPCNLVQTEVRNRTTGTFSVEELNDTWRTGRRINTDPFWKANINTARTMKFEFK